MNMNARHHYAGVEVNRLERSAGVMEEDTSDGKWEYRALRLPPEVSRLTATVRLQIQAEFGGWELSRVRLYPGGERKVWLRRRRTRHRLPELSY